MWVSIWRVPPPAGKVISVSSSGSVCFAAYSRILRTWYMCANAKEEEMKEEPAMWYCTDPNVEPEPEIVPRRTKLSCKEKQIQLTLL